MGHKMQISWSLARQPVLPWQPFCAPIVRGVGTHVSFQVYFL